MSPAVVLDQYSKDRSGLGTHICSSHEPGQCPPPWQMPPRYPQEIMKFGDNVQYDFWAMLANEANNHFEEMLSAKKNSYE